MTKSSIGSIYLNILEKTQDPIALRLGIIHSHEFAEDLKERARSASSLELLRSILDEHRRRVHPA